MNDLFAEYTPTPRSEALAPDVHASLRRAWMGVLGTLGVSFLLGIPFSFVRFRSSRPWEPIDLVLAGLAIAIFAVPIAFVFVWTLRRYVTLFRTGRLVEGVVVQQRPMGAVVQVAVSNGPNHSYVHGLQAPVGTRVPVVVGDAMSSRVLVVTAPRTLQRASLLTTEQLSQFGG